jgi:hypothetical protein
MGNYTKYRYYKGENENPFVVISIVLHLFLANQVLTLLISKESSALYSFFNDHRMGDQFMDLLSEDDKRIFD